MQHSSSSKIYLIEKIISVLTYITMGLAGLIWLMIAYFNKKKLKFFLMYNIVQSMIISIFCVAIKLIVDIILEIFARIPFLDFVAAIIYYVISFKIIRLSSGLSFTFFQLILTILLGYIIAGIFMGRIFYIPVLSRFMNKTMQNYM